jgi:hypothetical protein
MSWLADKRFSGAIPGADVATRNDTRLGGLDQGYISVMRRGETMDQSGNQIVRADNLEALRGMAARSVELIYVDPPFNAGRNKE